MKVSKKFVIRAAVRARRQRINNVEEGRLFFRQLIAYSRKPPKRAEAEYSKTQAQR